MSHHEVSMPVNWVRGSRRIGWLDTFPLATFLVAAFYEETKEFSPTNYEIAQTVDYDALAKKYGDTSSTTPTQPDWFEKNAPKATGSTSSETISSVFRQAIAENAANAAAKASSSVASLSTEVSGLGKLYFSPDVPKDIVDKVRKDFGAKHKPPAGAGDIFPSRKGTSGSPKLDLHRSQTSQRAQAGRADPRLYFDLGSYHPRLHLNPRLDFQGIQYVTVKYERAKLGNFHP